MSHAQYRNRAYLIIGANLVILTPGTLSSTQPHKTCLLLYVTSTRRAGHVPFTDNAYAFAPPPFPQHTVPALRNRYNYDSRAVHYCRTLAGCELIQTHIQRIFTFRAVSLQPPRSQTLRYVHMDEFGRNTERSRLWVYDGDGERVEQVLYLMLRYRLARVVASVGSVLTH